LCYLIEAFRESAPVRLMDARLEAILSKREQDVVRCVAEGWSNREIAKRLKLTEHTVKNYLFRIFDKLGVSSRVGVVLYVFRLRRDLTESSVSDDAHAAGSKPVSRAAKPNSRVVPNAVEAVRELARRSLV
jgi:DNA-binding CsgD family transcriptional regulator